MNKVMVIGHGVTVVLQLCYNCVTVVLLLFQ